MSAGNRSVRGSLQGNPRRFTMAALKRSQATSSSKKKSMLWRPSLSRLLANQNWEQIREVLEDDQSPDTERWLADCTDFMGQTALHLALKCQPPIDIIDLIIRHMSTSKIFPEQICDGVGMTPLHTAASWCAESNVVARLLKGAASKRAFLAKAMDFDGRLPLHLVCLNPSGTSAGVRYRRTFDEDDMKDDRLEVARILLDACPYSANSCDKHGKTPLDYAHENGGGEPWITLLKNARKDASLLGKSKQQTTKTSIATGMSRRYMGTDSSVASTVVTIPTEIEFPTMWTFEDDDGNLSDILL